MINVANFFDNLPKATKDEVFEEIIANKNLKVERIITNGQVTPKGEWYDQTTNEWVLVLQGAAQLLIQEGETLRIVDMKAGDHVLLPAHCKHRVEWTDKQQTTIWLAIHFIPM